MIEKTKEQIIKELYDKSLRLTFYGKLELFDSLSNDEKKIYIENIIIKNSNFQQFDEYFPKMPGDMRLKYLKYLDFDNLYDYTELIENIEDEETYYEILKNLLLYVNKEYEVIDIFELVPQNKKIEFFTQIRKKEEQLGKNIIDSYNLGEYLIEFNYEERFKILKDVIFKDFYIDKSNQESYYNINTRFKSHNYDDILRIFMEENIEQDNKSIVFEVLNFLIEESKKIIDKTLDIPVGIETVDEIIGLFYEKGYDYIQIIKILIDSNCLNKRIGYFEIIKNIPENEGKLLFEFLIKYLDDVEPRRKMSELEFFSNIELLSKKTMSELFVKYVLDEKIYDYEYPLKLNGTDKKYNSIDYLEIIINNLSENEFKTQIARINALLAANYELAKWDTKYESVIKRYSQYYNLKEENLNLFIQKFGFIVLTYLEDEVIINIVNMSNEKIKKLFELFEDETHRFDKQTINDVLNSFLQRKFMIEKKDIYNIFTTFESLVQTGNQEKIIKLLETIKKEIDLEIILRDNNITYNELVTQIKNGDLELLHKITNKYIALKREEYLEDNYNFEYNQLNLDKVISRASYKRDTILNKSLYITYNCQILPESLFSKEQLFLIRNNQIIDELINFKKNPKEYNLNNEYRKYLKTLNEILDIMYDNKVNFIFYNLVLPNDDNFNTIELKFDRIQKKISKEHFLNILSECNFNGLSYILENDNIFNKLKEYLSKYKILGWQDTFSKLIVSSDCLFDESTIASLICNFDKLEEKVDSNKSLTSIIDSANCYSSISIFYTLLFGIEDFYYISGNPGKNKASMSKKERLFRNLELVKDMYSRAKISIPPINKEIYLPNQKSIVVNIGNSTNMMNLTYGERTQSCMRQGGAFKDLFEYCIKNENGFHIRFSSPKTGKLVSRVSGVRNGNTIFLNELRNSLDETYSDEDLYMAIKQVSEEIATLSKESKLPIENIIITKDYALESHKEEKKNINLTAQQCHKAVHSIHFNLINEGIILKQGNNPIEYNFTNNVPTYETMRDDIKEYSGELAIKRMLQLHMINDLLNGISVYDIDTSMSFEQTDFVISGEDFYISFKGENTEIYILDKRKENQRTIEEIEYVLKKMKNKQNGRSL